MNRLCQLFLFQVWIFGREVIACCWFFTLQYKVLWVNCAISIKFNLIIMWLGQFLSIFLKFWTKETKFKRCHVSINFNFCVGVTYGWKYYIIRLDNINWKTFLNLFSVPEIRMSCKMLQRKWVSEIVSVHRVVQHPLVDKHLGFNILSPNHTDQL